MNVEISKSLWPSFWMGRSYLSPLCQHPNCLAGRVPQVSNWFKPWQFCWKQAFLEPGNFLKWLWVKNRYPKWVALVNGDKDYNLRSNSWRFNFHRFPERNRASYGSGKPISLLYLILTLLRVSWNGTVLNPSLLFLINIYFQQ